MSLLCEQLTHLSRQVKALERELERHRHGVTLEGDFICPDSPALTEALGRVKALEGALRAAYANESRACRCDDPGYIAQSDSISKCWLCAARALLPAPATSLTAGYTTTSNAPLLFDAFWTAFRAELDGRCFTDKERADGHKSVNLIGSLKSHEEIARAAWSKTLLPAPAKETP